MHVKMIRERIFGAAGPLGPFTKVYEIGSVHDVPDMHAQMLVSGGDAEYVSGTPSKPTPAPAAKPAAKRKK